MKILVIAGSPEQYEEWLAENNKSPQMHIYVTRAEQLRKMKAKVMLIKGYQLSPVLELLNSFTKVYQLNLVKELSY